MKWRVHDQVEPPTVAPSRPADIGRTPDRDLAGAVHVAKIVRRRLRANSDWNINDWKDVADALSAFVLRSAGEDPHAH